MPDMIRMPTAVQSKSVKVSAQGRKASSGAPKFPSKPGGKDGKFVGGACGQVPCKW